MIGITAFEPFQLKSFTSLLFLLISRCFLGEKQTVLSLFSGIHVKREILSFNISLACFHWREIHNISNNGSVCVKVKSVVNNLA